MTTTHETPNKTAGILTEAQRIELRAGRRDAEMFLVGAICRATAPDAVPLSEALEDLRLRTRDRNREAGRT